MNELRTAYRDALENYEANKKSGSPAESLAYDAGVIEGLKRSLEIVEKTIDEYKR